jgi:hypothetical protein
LATRERSIENTEQLFCLEGSTEGAEMAKAAFLIRAGKVCGFEMTATATLDRLLVSVFQEHLESVKVKIRAWKTSGSEQIATVAQK